MNQESLIIRCQQCGTKNRIPQDRAHQRPLCGRCKTPLPASPRLDHPVSVTDGTFKEEVLSHPGPVLVDCWAPWCGPCRMVAPILDQLAAEYAGKIKIAKLNVDENPVTAGQYGIQSIPTMIFFKRGRVVDKLIGALPKPEIEKHLGALI